MTACKVFPLDEAAEGGEKKKKLQIKAKYTISDGISQVKALVPDTHYNKFVSLSFIYLLYSAQTKEPKNFDVIKIENFQKTIVNG